ncbi:MAG: glycerol-3-phosphate dehydrogenase, partial [Paraglaciecola sp.]
MTFNQLIITDFKENVVLDQYTADHSFNRKSPELDYDVAIVGAGVVGCAMARRLTLDGAKVIVLEKASDVLDGASKSNSAILHTGFDAPPDSLEQA